MAWGVESFSWESGGPVELKVSFRGTLTIRVTFAATPEDESVKSDCQITKVDAPARAEKVYYRLPPTPEDTVDECC